MFTIRRARPGDAAAVRALHALLEVQYEEAFLSSLTAAGADDALIVLVAEHRSGDSRDAGASAVVGVLAARVEWSARGLLSWATAALEDVAASLGWHSQSPPPPPPPPLQQQPAEPSRSGGGHPGYILTLVVSPAHRGRGLASALLARAAALLVESRGCDEVSLHCLASNAAARALYRKAGFVEEAVLRNYYSFGAGTHDGVLLRWRAGQPPSPPAPCDGALAPAAALAAAAAAAAPLGGGDITHAPSSATLQGGGGGGSSGGAASDIEAAPAAESAIIIADDSGNEAARGDGGRAGGGSSTGDGDSADSPATRGVLSLFLSVLRSIFG